MLRLFGILFVFTSLLLAEYIREGELVTDTTRKLIWQDDNASISEVRSFEGANEYCNALRLGGFDNWRVPSLEELATIVNENLVNPAIYKSFKNTANDFYWSSSSIKNDRQYARSINFYVGYQSFSPKDANLHIRCVRDIDELTR